MLKYLLFFKKFRLTSGRKEKERELQALHFGFYTFTLGLIRSCDKLG